MQENLTYAAFENRYREKDYIGSGGFAKVYKVFDHANNRYVALKVSDVRPDWEKFTLQREVQLVNSLPKHRNITRYDACYRYNTGLSGEMDFAILEFSEEGNLEQFLEKEELTKKDKQIIIRGILDGISFLHKNDVIHRDLKAQNILMYRESGVWTPKITDFGLSRLTKGSSVITNSSIGISYAYAAPEQIQNDKIDKNVDLWAIGVILYRILVGELPFQGKKGTNSSRSSSQLELSKKIINVELPYEQLNKIEEPYQSMIKKCLVKHPKERIQSAEKLISMLDEKQLDERNFDEKEEANTVIVKREKPQEEKTPPYKNNKEENTIVVVSENPSYEPPTVPDYIPPVDYSIPKDNVTQVIPDEPIYRPTAPTPPPQSLQGGDNKFNWFWLLIPLLLVCIIGGVAFLIPKDSPTPPPPETSKTKTLDIKPIGFQYDLFNRRILKAKKDKDKLLSMEKMLEKEIAKYPKDYRPMYLLAKCKLNQQKSKTAMERLNVAVKIAKANGASSKMLKMIKGERNNAPLLILAKSNKILEKLEE